MSFADAIAVNSNFTKGVVSRTWPALVRRKKLETVYPCVDTKPKEKETDDEPLWKGMKFILSINRFERKKDVALAIKAFAGLSKEERAGVRLAVAGGYDPRVAENVSYHNELVDLAESLSLKNMTVKTPQTAQAVPRDVEVLFLQNVTNILKEMLLSSARLLVYTPANEHFGIVPLEAMLRGLPVLAANTGGPTETVVEGVTGWLRSPDNVDEWTAVMNKVLHQLSAEDLAKISEAGIKRVKNGFGEAQMAERLDSIFDGMLQGQQDQQHRQVISTAVLLSAGGIGLLAATVALVTRVLR
jgi:alpha-1,3/alpha-1,6-mannosyltransferase